MPKELIKTAIVSPMVGFLYTRYAPDAPPYVSVGSAVHPDSTVCVIEAMKVFVEIPAGGTGIISEILVENGQSVEFGQLLFHVMTDDPEAFQLKNFSVEDFFHTRISESEIDPPLRDQILRRSGG